MTTDKPMECQWLNLACDRVAKVAKYWIHWWIAGAIYCEGQTLETELAPQGLTTAPTTQKHKR